MLSITSHIIAPTVPPIEKEQIAGFSQKVEKGLTVDSARELAGEMKAFLCKQKDKALAQIKQYDTDIVKVNAQLEEVEKVLKSLP